MNMMNIMMMIITTKDKYEYGDDFENDENYNYDDDDDNFYDQDNKCDDDDDNDDMFKSLSHIMCVSVYIASHVLSISCLNRDNNNNRLQKCDVLPKSTFSSAPYPRVMHHVQNIS